MNLSIKKLPGPESKLEIFSLSINVRFVIPPMFIKTIGFSEIMFSFINL